MPRFILLDLAVPKMNGFEFLAWIRHESEVTYLPVVVLTGSLSPADARHAYQAGANCYVAKEADATDLAAMLTQLCDFWLNRCIVPDASKNANLSIIEQLRNPTSCPTEAEAEALAA
jgi:DNA-binding NarL/FixJ family response regulator